MWDCGSPEIRMLLYNWTLLQGTYFFFLHTAYICLMATGVYAHRSYMWY